MEINRVGKRGVLFTFYDLGGLETNIYIIDGQKNIFIADTFLGPAAMEKVKEYIDSNFAPKPVVIFNTHFHWDHVWGNCAFKGRVIISHEICREMILKSGKDDLIKYGRHMMGDVEVVPPEITFSESLIFHDDRVKFFHSPGHTEDSSSMMDMDGNVLFVGDNIESPIPYLNCNDFDRYLQTLEGYLKMDGVKIIAGHCRKIDNCLIEENMEYIRKFRDGDINKYKAGIYSMINEENIKVLGAKNK